MTARIHSRTQVSRPIFSLSMASVHSSNQNTSISSGLAVEANPLWEIQQPHSPVRPLPVHLLRCDAKPGRALPQTPARPESLSHPAAISSLLLRSPGTVTALPGCLGVGPPPSSQSSTENLAGDHLGVCLCLFGGVLLVAWPTALSSQGSCASCIPFIIRHGCHGRM